MSKIHRIKLAILKAKLTNQEPIVIQKLQQQLDIELKRSKKDGNV